MTAVLLIALCAGAGVAQDDAPAAGVEHATSAAEPAAAGPAAAESEVDGPSDPELAALHSWREGLGEGESGAASPTDAARQLTASRDPLEPIPFLPPGLDADLRVRLAQLHARLGDSEGAERLYAEAIGLGREDVAPWWGLARALVHNGDTDGARAAFATALQIAGNGGQALHRDHGELMLLLRAPAAAAGSFQAALERAATPQEKTRAQQLLARAQHEANPAQVEAPAPWPLLALARTQSPGMARAESRLENAWASLPASLHPGMARLGDTLTGARGMRRGGWALAALFALLVVARVARGRGDLAIAIEYPSELRGTFTVRLLRRQPTNRRRPDPTAILKGGASTRSVHTLVSRETQFRRLRPGRYYVAVEGLLQASDSGEVLEDMSFDQPVVVKRGLTQRICFDARPGECAVDIHVMWDKRPAKDAGVAALGTPGSLRYARGGPVRLPLAQGAHSIAVGSGDRVAVCEIVIDSFEPKTVSIDLAGSADVIFKGCPPAVELYLHGDVHAAARALEREGQTEQAHLLLARELRQEGRTAEAAKYFERADRPLEAAALHADLSAHARAAELFEKGGDSLRAAEMYKSAGDTLRAGGAYESARDFESAIACYREVGAADRWVNALERCGLVFEAAEVALEHDERARAIRLLQQVLPEDPRYADACRLLAESLEREGHNDLAAQKLEEHLSAAGRESAAPDLHFHLSELLEEAGEYRRALSVLEDLRRREPTYPNLATRIEVLRKRCSHAELEDSRASQPLRGKLAATAPLLDESRYEIKEEIGRGGMGVVYRAHDLRLNREVALKRMPENLREHPRAVEYFLREAQAAARLNHRNIVTVYDVDQEDGMFFITMELLKGHPLNAVLKSKGRIGPRDVARLGMQVAAGLDYAHEHRVVHRDIKTANLFLTTAKTVMIMDFGLAKTLEEVRKGSTIIGGTPYYMAPEQAAGDEVDHRADLYALGVTLFELATGKVPFADGDIAFHHRHTAPPHPASFVEDGLPDALSSLILHLMEKDRERRPASAAEVVAALEATLRD